MGESISASNTLDMLRRVGMDPIDGTMELVDAGARVSFRFSCAAVAFMTIDSLAGFLLVISCKIDRDETPVFEFALLNGPEPLMEAREWVLADCGEILRTEPLICSEQTLRCKTHSLYTKKAPSGPIKQLK